MNNEGYYGLLAGPSKTSRLAFTNNVMVEGGDAIVGPGALPGLSSISMFFPDGHFAGGVYPGANKKVYPVNNFYPLTARDIGFVNHFKRDYRLSTKSIYKNGATDGTDPGCDFVALALAQK